MYKVLFISNHRLNRSPSQRFRFEQYISFLEENNWECSHSSIISEKSDKYFYKKGYLLKKAITIIKAFFIRLKDLKNANKFDIIFIQREAFFTGTTFFEKQFKKSKAKIIFDFDDSIWLSNVSDANKKWSWLKNASKTKEIITLSDIIIAGNLYLSDYASQTNKNIKIIPTTIDTLEYQRINSTKTKICIGRSGSITTIQHFNHAVPFLKKIKEKYGDIIEFKVIGDGKYKNQELEIKGIEWEKKTEIRELSSFDIGIMPLPDDKWANGKCGLKCLQYMALEIPTIMSPVGVNRNIIQDGRNGFLASKEEEWIDKISQLIESKELRSSIGIKGRETVLKEYSIEANKNQYLDLFNSVLS